MDQERIIFIIDYLSRFTDKNRYVSIKDIQDHLCEVTNLKRVAEVTIRRDLDRLTSMGNNIVRVTREHGTAYYALLDNSITFNEIRFIVDSISINKFLSSAQLVAPAKERAEYLNEVRKMLGAYPEFAVKNSVSVVRQHLG